jgi:hypothetical protein
MTGLAQVATAILVEAGRVIITQDLADAISDVATRRRAGLLGMVHQGNHGDNRAKVERDKSPK